MPITTTIDHENQCVRATCSGPFALEEFAKYHQTVWALPEVFGYNEIFDARECNPAGVAYGDILTLVENASKLLTVLPQSRSAVLISTETQRTLFDFYKNVRASFTRNPPALESFASIEEAEMWIEKIGLPE